MKKTVSTATALSTAIVIALGGIALGGRAASAEPAPLGPTASATPSDVGPVVDGVAEQAFVEDAPAPTALTEDDATEPSEPSEPTEPTTDVPPVPQEVVTRAATFSVASPAQGAVYPTLGYALTIDSTEASFSYEVFDSAGRRVQEESGVAGPRATRYVHLSDDAPADQSMTVVVTSADGTVLGSETRSFRVEVPTSPAVTISSPRPGEVLRTPSTTSPGGGSFVLEGTAVPGSWLRYSYEALTGQTGWGSDYDAPVVPSDGAWAIGDGLPYGSWRATVQQYAGAGDPALGGVQEPSLSRASAPVTVDFTLAPPVSVSAPASGATPDEPAVVPVGVRPTATTVRIVPVARRAALASTGPSGSTAWIGLAGMVLAGVGAVTVLVARPRASRG